MTFPQPEKILRYDFWSEDALSTGENVPAHHWWKKLSCKRNTSHIYFQIEENRILLLHFLIKQHFLNKKTFGAMIFDQKILFQQDKLVKKVFLKNKTSGMLMFK